MSKGLQLGVAALTVFGAVTWFLASQAGGSGTFLYYSSVESFLNVDAPESQAEASGRGSRVHGFVVEGSISKDLPAGYVDFAIHDEGSLQMPIRYLGIDVPDLFRDGAEVVVEGRVVSGRFLADRVMAKCPSKYEAEAPDAPEA